MLNKNQKSKIKNQKGFSLLETIVAIAVLALAIAGSLSLVSQGIKAASFFKNQTTAFYLATEAIEYVRNSRDTHILGGESWANWREAVSLCDNAGGGCRVDATLAYTNPNAIKRCNPQEKILLLDPASKLYNHQIGSQTIFERCVFITDISSREAEIKTEIFWRERFGNQNFILKGNILNWQ